MFEKTNGSRAEVWHGTAKKTSGGLTKSNLMKNKHGRIVSRRKHASGKKSIKHLEKLGYKAKKGHFTLFRKGHKGSRKMRGGTGSPMEMMGKGKMMGGKKCSRKMRGGMSYGGPLSPHSYNGKGVGTSGAGLQIMATTM